MSEKHIDEITGVETTGHEWDGIRELNNPMPRWWLLTFYATIVWALGYTIAYPAWPLISSATTGLLGYSSRAELDSALTEAQARQQRFIEAIAARDVEEILADDELRQFAISAGGAAFRINCVQCHGSGAEGSPGYPNLNDDDWLWGGSPEEIRYTIAHGIRFADDDETRYSEMPAYAGVLEPRQISEVAAYVVSLTGTPRDPSMVEPGREVFAEQCAACHGDDARGSREFGAPDLADAIWFYGSSEADIARQIRQPRHGVMPGWQERLGDVTVKQLAVYVYSLGGGE